MSDFRGGRKWIRDEGGNISQYPDSEDLNSGLVGAWKTFAEDASSDPIAFVGGSLTLGDGILWGRWWTPGPVELSPTNDTPFLCIIEAFLQLGSTSSFTGKPHLNLPEGIDGDANYNIVMADDADYPFLTSVTHAFAKIAALAGAHRAFGIGQGLNVLYSTSEAPGSTAIWDPTTPETWAEGDSLYLVSTFRAKLQYVGD